MQTSKMWKGPWRYYNYGYLWSGYGSKNVAERGDECNKILGTCRTDEERDRRQVNLE